MWHLDSVSIETAFNIMRVLGFLLICSLGGVAWLIWFLIQEQKKPVEPWPLSTIAQSKIAIADLVKKYQSWHQSWHQSQIATRWADPEYYVVNKKLRTPFPQQEIDKCHAEALNMIRRREYE